MYATMLDAIRETETPLPAEALRFQKELDRFARRLERMKRQDRRQDEARRTLAALKPGAAARAFAEASSSVVAPKGRRTPPLRYRKAVKACRRLMGRKGGKRQEAAADAILDALLDAPSDAGAEADALLDAAISGDWKAVAALESSPDRYARLDRSLKHMRDGVEALRYLPQDADEAGQARAMLSMPWRSLQALRRSMGVPFTGLSRPPSDPQAAALVRRHYRPATKEHRR